MSGQYDMNTDPSTWPRPDDVDMIAAAERYEASDDYIADVRDWLATSDDAYEWAADAFTATAEYDRSFIKWMDRQLG